MKRRKNTFSTDQNKTDYKSKIKEAINILVISHSIITNCRIHQGDNPQITNTNNRVGKRKWQNSVITIPSLSNENFSLKKVGESKR